MAASDYRLCDVCGCKTFYDSNLNYEWKRAPFNQLRLERMGDWAVICISCSADYEVLIEPKSIWYWGA